LCDIDVGRLQVGIVLSGCAAEAVVRADADRLNQALTNLLSNAMKFSPPGGTVEVGVNCSAKGVRISVTDHGPGIPENFRKRIFERFSQADSSDTRQTGGSGLGLSIAREIVTRHGGSLSYETEMGTGTTFHIDLPQAASLNHERWQLSPSDHEPVAICADDRAKAELICATLMSEGFSPTIFATPEEALQELGRLKPRAVVVDVPFGNQDVSQLVPALRDRCNSPVMPVIVVSLNATGSGMPEVALAFPIVDWVTGPAELTRLPGLVRSLALRAAPDRPRILHVEDDRDVLEVVRQALDGEFNVTPAPTLEVARIRLAQERYDIVILDLTLSDGLGKDLIPALVDTAGRPIPTVVFSAQDATAELAVNVEAILTKSRANLATLVDAVRAVIARPPGDVVTRKGAVS
jgi:DNA-binding response OmpR family regulator/anti-sigma regulatory factor (Ser/Thr protein kinase)